MNSGEIGSWFSLALPIKTSAGFLIKRRIGMKRRVCLRIHTNFHEKEIGSGFSLASPIKTTAGFSIKKRIGMKRGSWPTN